MKKDSGPPFPQSFWVRTGQLCAGCYPASLNALECNQKLQGLLACGIRRIVSLVEPNETGRNGIPFIPYVPLLEKLATEQGASVEFEQFPIRDASVPTTAMMMRILDDIDAALGRGIPTYVHCWGGHGRTGTVVACHLVRHGQTPDQAIATVLRLHFSLPKNPYPFEGPQEALIRTWMSGD